MIMKCEPFVYLICMCVCVLYNCLLLIEFAKSVAESLGSGGGAFEICDASLETRIFILQVGDDVGLVLRLGVEVAEGVM